MTKSISIPLMTAVLTIAASGLVALVPTAAAQCTEPSVYAVGVRVSCPSTGASTWAGTCGGIGAGAGTSGGSNGGAEFNACVNDCTSSGIGGVGVQLSGDLSTQCFGVAQPTVISCALYMDMTVSPPVVKYPGQTGVVIDYPAPGYHPADGDVAFCVSAACPAATPFGFTLNNQPHCFAAPAPCGFPGAGWTVGVTAVACVGAPWVGVEPVTPSACPPAATIGVTIYWGTTPVVGGPPANVFCF